MELARDPGLLLGHRRRGLPVHLPFEVCGPLLEQLRTILPAPHQVAGQPGATHQDASEQYVGSGAVLDKDRQPGQAQGRERRHERAAGVVGRGGDRDHHRQQRGEELRRVHPERREGYPCRADNNDNHQGSLSSPRQRQSHHQGSRGHRRRRPTLDDPGPHLGLKPATMR
jgi:hypothetical protein